MTKPRKLRSVPSRTVEVCEIIEARGPIGITKLSKFADGISINALSKVCCVAAVNKLLIGSVKPLSKEPYTVAPNWRDIVAERGISAKVFSPLVKPVQPEKTTSKDSEAAWRRPDPGPTRYTGVSSVFQLGASA